MPESDAEFLKQLREAFRLEAEDHLQAMRLSLKGIEDHVRAVEGSGATVEPEIAGELLERIYRETHTLKGAARAVNATPIETLCQALEDVFAAWKRRDRTPSPEAFDPLYRAVNAIQAAVAAHGESRPLAEPDQELLRSLREAAGAGAGGPGPTGRRPGLVRSPRPAPASAPPQAAPLSGQAGRAPEKAPSAPAAPGSPASGAAPPSAPAASPAAPPPAAPGSGPAVSLSAAEPEVALPSSVRVSAAHIEDLVLQIEELTSVRQAAARCTSILDQAMERLVSLAAGRRGESGAAGTGTGPARDIAELLVAARAACAEAELQLGTCTVSLGDTARRMLRLPASVLLDQLQFAVRDLTRTTARDVAVEFSGGDVRLDRRILEDLKDILIHMLRNAVDHGIEDREARLAAGKSAQGRIRVSLTQSTTGLVTVRVEDDGRGIDLEALRRAAVAKEFLSEAEASLLSPDEVLQLMFRSEISTSSRVTEVSGRGLGMAIVREKVVRLGGDIGVESTPGQGTAFRMTLPSMRSTFRGVLVTVGGQEFVLPSIHLARALLVSSVDDVQMVEGRETIVSEGELLPLVRLGDLLGVRHEAPAQNGGRGGRHIRTPAVVVVSGGRSVALGVDRLGAEEEILPRPLGSLFSGTRHFESAAVTGSGRLALVLDAGSLVEAAGQESPRSSPVRRSSSASPGQPRQRRPALLVADDSVTTRMLLKNVLEGSGFLVDTAVDGADAWAKLQAGSYDAVVTDVEMPRLNGFELTARIRADRRLAGLPVVLVTALASDVDRERGVEAGASAYIVKSGFDQANLIDSLRSLL